MPVNHTQGAHPAAVAQAHRRTGIEADVRLAAYQRVVGKPGVLCGIGHFKQPIGQDGMRTKSDIAWRFRYAGQTDVGLEPLAPGVNQADQRYRHTAYQ